MDVTIDVANYSQSPISAYYARSDDVIRKVFQSHLEGNGTVPGLLADVNNIFLMNDGIVLRLLKYSSSGVVLSLRVFKMAALDCLWRRYLSRDLHDALARIIVNNATMAALRVRYLDINVNIAEEDYMRFKNVYFVYQSK